MLDIKFNTADVLRQLTNVQKKQIPFARQLTLNRTAEERQRLMQDRITTQLIIRRASDRSRFRKIVLFARADRAQKTTGPTSATIRILGGDTKATAPVNQRFGSLVLRQEQGGQHTSSELYRHGNQLVSEGFIIPAPGLRTATKGVSRKLYPKSIGLSLRQAIAQGNEFTTSYKGGKKKRGKGFKKGTKFFFVKPGVGIFQREQIGKHSEYDAVWFFRRRITIPRRLQLAETFADGLAQNIQRNFAGFLDFALRTAK